MGASAATHLPIGGHEGARGGSSNVVVSVETQAQKGSVLGINFSINPDVKQIEVQRAGINQIQFVKDGMVVLYVENPILIVVLVICKPEQAVLH